MGSSSAAENWGGFMASVDEAARMARELPGVTEGQRYGHRSWSVAGNGAERRHEQARADRSVVLTATTPKTTTHHKFAPPTSHLSG